MIRNLTITIFVDLLVIFSLFFLVRLLSHESQKLAITSEYRFIGFIFIHIYILCMMGWFLILYESYEYARWGFYLSFIPSLIILGIEVFVFQRFTHNSRYKPSRLEPLQLGFLNCYFLIFMYALIGSFLSGMYLCLTRTLMFFHERRISKAISDNINQIKFEQKYKEKDCAICLYDFNQQNAVLMKIRCSHIFHKSCLIQWIRVNQSCPICRYSIFQDLNADQRQNVEFN